MPAVCRNPCRRRGGLLAPDRADEGGTLQAFKTIQAEVFDSAIAERDGRLVKTTGDGFLVEFGSVCGCCAARSRCRPIWPSATRRWRRTNRIEMQLLNQFRSPQRFLSMHAAVHNNFNFNAISSRDRRSGFSEPKRRTNGRRRCSGVRSDRSLPLSIQRSLP